MRKEHVLERFSFSGHESFPFRYAWLPKGVRGVLDRPDLFLLDEAPVLLGVGKNMVSSIRHWCRALGLIESPEQSGRFQATELGGLLFGSEGWDPYLEDVATLWLLHWLLVSRVDRASTWHLAFTRWTTASFTRDQLVSWLAGIASQSPSTRATENSLRRDVDVFVRSYIPARASRDLSLEDTFDCPLVELGLLQETESRLYQFTRGSRPSLPVEVFVFAILDYWREHAPLQKSLSFESIQSGNGSPGGAFKLTESALAGLLENLPGWSGLSYDETAGTRVLLRSAAFGDDLVHSPIEALVSYYGTRTATLGQTSLVGVW